LAALPASGATPFAREMLEAQNAVRSRAGVPPLEWSDRLAGVAQTWARRLLKTGKFRHTAHSPYGENLFEIRGASAKPSRVVDNWASEAADYDYARNTCRHVCGHYTQIVWRDTKQVGCGVARGRARAREVWVCEYDPPGNWVGQRPY
jgi:pathogenesis-related protein 1